MASNGKSNRFGATRAATLLFPPAGLILLWRGKYGFGRKLLGTAFIFLYTILYTVFTLWFLWKYTGLKFEMRGNPFPVPTYWPSVPDFKALEASRAAQTNVVKTAKYQGGVYWTNFRGPNRDGQYAEQTVLTNWPAKGPVELWRQPIGGGYASFVIAHGLAFTIEQRREQEAIAAYDLQTGREVWTLTYPGLFHEWMGGDGPRATPTWHDGRLYALGAQGDLHCVEAATGKLLWKRKVLLDTNTDNLPYGMTTSPLVVDDKLIVSAGATLGANSKSIIAYNRLTGEPLWQADQDTQAYASPMLVTLAGVRQLLVVSAKRVMGLSPVDGKMLWDYPWIVPYENAISQPVITGTNRFVISAGYGTGAAGVEIAATGSGLQAKEIWRNKLLKNKFASSVFLNGCLYGLDEDILVCVDASTGERKWKGERYGYGQLLLASGHLIILCGDGDLALVKANPEKSEELARFTAIKGKTWNHPALADGKLLVRNATEMACYDLSVKK